MLMRDKNSGQFLSVVSVNGMTGQLAWTDSVEEAYQFIDIPTFLSIKIVVHRNGIEVETVNYYDHNPTSNYTIH